MLRHSKSGFAEVQGDSVAQYNEQHVKVAVRAMGRALAQDRLCLAYQPIVKSANPDFWKCWKATRIAGFLLMFPHNRWAIRTGCACFMKPPSVRIMSRIG